MKIVVCFKEVIDTAINLGYGLVSEALARKGLAFKLSPADTHALAEALAMKGKDAGVEITLVSLGGERLENYLRDGLALGADKAVRVWDNGLENLSPYQKAKILSRAVSLLGAGLVLAGAKSPDNASGLVGPFIAARLEMPYVSEVEACELEGDGNSITVTRNVKKGMREKVRVTLPAVLAVAKSGAEQPYASLDKILESRAATIDCLSLTDLGISPLELKKDPTRVTGLSFPRPRTRAAPLDSSLPAFDRILALLQGGISRRRGEILRGNIDEQVNQLFELFMKEGLIKPVVKL